MVVGLDPRNWSAYAAKSQDRVRLLFLFAVAGTLGEGGEKSRVVMFNVTSAILERGR